MLNRAEQSLSWKTVNTKYQVLFESKYSTFFNTSNLKIKKNLNFKKKFYNVA